MMAPAMADAFNSIGQSVEHESSYGIDSHCNKIYRGDHSCGV